MKIESDLDKLSEELLEQDFDKLNSMLSESEALMILGITGIDKMDGTMALFVSKVSVTQLATMIVTLSDLHPNLMAITNHLLILKHLGRQEEYIGNISLENRKDKNREKKNL